MNDGKCLLAFAALALLVALSAGAASAQSRTGPFTEWNGWWLHPTQGTLGISFDGTAIRIDRDGDGGTDSVFVRPTGAQGIPDAAIGSLRLTPSRTIVYAFGGVCPSTGGTLVYFFDVPAFGNRLEPIRTGLCIPRGIDRVGFYDTGRCDEPNGIGQGLDCTTNQRLGVSPQRIAYFATASSAFGFENFIWVDLRTGASSTASAFDYANGLGFVHVSPSGTQAFIQHDLGQVGETDYRLVDLCPGTMGTVINMGGFPISNVNAVLAAEVTAVAAGMVTIEVTPTAPPVSFDLVDCLDAPGACCGDFGCVGDQITASVCSNYGDQYTFLGPATACSACPAPPLLEACCFETGEPICERLSAEQCTGQGGDPQSGVSFCAADTCPTPNTTFTISGPANAGVGDEVTFDLDYENTGGVTAPGVEIEMQLPYGTTFVGASNGGDWDGTVVRWMIGNLGPGAAGSVSVTFSIGCLAANQSAFLSGLISYLYSIEGNRIYYPPTNNPTLEIEAAASGPVTVAVAGTPDREPLLPGDEVEHAITITNSNASAIPAIKIGSASFGVPMGLDYGNAMSFDRVLDAAGGTVDTSGGDFEWTGDVPAGASRTIRFVTAVDACVPPSSEETSLNFEIEVAAFDLCDTEIGQSGPPPIFALGHRADVSIAATNLAPPQRLSSPLFDIDVQVARPGAAVDLVVSLESSGGALPGASVSAFVRGINVTVPPTEPGASWNPGTREFAWTGTIPANGSVDVHMTGTLTACRGEVDLDGATSPACLAMPDIRAQTTIAAVPEPPPGPWLAALGQRSSPFPQFGIEEHLLWIDPGPPVQTITMLCLPDEYVRGIGASPNGDVWVTWLPTYRLNPRTLDFQPFDLDLISATGLGNLEDVAVDPVDGSVYFSGNAYDPLLGGSAAKIVRYDPVAGTVESFFDDSSYTAIRAMAVDGAGSIAALANTGAQNMLVRIDPTAPSDEDVLYDPTSTVLTDVAIDRDGSYIVIDGAFGTTPVVYDVDRDTGDRTTLVADLRVPFPGAQYWGQLDVAANGDLFVAPSHPGLGRIRRATPDVGEILRPILAGGVGTFADLAMVGLPTPEPAGAALALAACGALVLLRRSRVARR